MAVHAMRPGISNARVRIRSMAGLCGVLRMGKLAYPTVFLPLHDDKQGSDWASGGDRPAVVHPCT